MVRALSDLGIVVDVVTTTADGKRELDIPIASPIPRSGGRYFYFPRQRPKFWMFSWALKKWLDRHVADYDLVHVHGLFAYTTLPASAAARRNGTPYVITPHGALDPWCLSHKWWKKFPYFEMLERRNLKGAATIQATSRLEADGLAAVGFEANVRVIPLSVEVPQFPAPFNLNPR
jgi:glycosyltransferase involved in cell wall biosynthesis